MPDIDSLLEQAEKKKFKKSSYRPWNYMDEIQKEEEYKQDKTTDSQLLNLSSIEKQNNIVSNEESKDILVSSNEISHQNENNNVIHEIDTLLIQKEQTNSPLYNILRLSGHQKVIFNFILEKCLARGLLSTGMITSEMLTSITNTSLSMVNTSIQRLVEKGIISRENGKRGRGGFYCFCISQQIKNAAIEYRRITSLDNLDPFKIAENQTNKLDIPNFDIKNNLSALPPEWKEIDIEPLASIGFTKGHLLQLFKQGIDIASLQDSINFFAYDLKYNNKTSSITKSSPLGYFMGILKRIGIYNAPENYESPKNRALREMLEHKKQEKEKYDNMVKELINMEFDEWQNKLTQEEKDNLIPIEIRKTKLLSAKQASLKSHFIEHVWPSLSLKYTI